MILIQRYTVLEEEVEQSFHKCGNLGATLYIMRVDVVAFFFVRLANKKAIVYCNETNKTISKKQWNASTKSQAEQLLAQHKTPKLGRYLLMLIFVALIGGFWWVEFGSKQTNSDYNPLHTLPMEQQREIISKLQVNDLIMTYKGMFKIIAVGENDVTLEKSSVKIEAFGQPINPDSYPDSTFSNPIKVSKEHFNLGTVVLPEAGAGILDYYDSPN